MKPHRIRMAHNLLLNYGLYRKMEIYVRRPSTPHTHRRVRTRAKTPTGPTDRALCRARSDRRRRRLRS